MLTARASLQVSKWLFFGVAALLFVVSTALTIRWCTGMSMGELPMPGGWTLSMTWRRLCGQTWFDAELSFLATWVTMMGAMMLPALTPALWRYYQVINQVVGRRSDNGGTTYQLLLTAIVGLGYFFVWALIGIAAYPIGVVLAMIEMRSSALASVVPIITGLVVLIVGASQFTVWKADRLACCRAIPRRQLLPTNFASACRHGMHLGLHCSYCCAGLTLILFVIGVMDLRVMLVVTIAITVERLALTGERVARVIGVALVAAGLVLIVPAAGLM
jgi:predicted metal-binding membrane protein